MARRQLVAFRLHRRTIDEWLATGRLHLIHRGVYAVGHRSLTREGRWLAAVFAADRDAVLSHRSAAALWGLRATAATRVDVTVPRRGRRSLPGITVHTTRELLDCDRTVRAGIPVTSVGRTLLDIAEVIPQRQLARAFEEAERLRLLDLNAIEDVCRRGRGRRGLGALCRVAASQAGPAPVTRSELERAFLDFCEEHRLPKPTLNALVNGLEVDALWARERLIVELDGYAFHHTRAAFERDRARDAVLMQAGYRVLRITDRRLRQEGKATAAALRSLVLSERVATVR